MLRPVTKLIYGIVSFIRNFRLMTIKKKKYKSGRSEDIYPLY